MNTVPGERVPQEGAEGLLNQPQSREVSEPNSPKESIGDIEFADAILRRITLAPNEESRRVWLKALALVTGEPSADQRQPE